MSGQQMLATSVSAFEISDLASYSPAAIPDKKAFSMRA